MPIPVSRLARSHGELVALLGFAQRLFDAPARRHISDGAVPAYCLSLGIARRAAGSLDPAVLAATEARNSISIRAVFRRSARRPHAPASAVTENGKLLNQPPGRGRSYPAGC